MYANIKEGLYGQSTKDYIHKVNIALKEAGETEYCLELLIETGYIDKKHGEDLLEGCVELIKMLVSIVKTSKGQLKDNSYKTVDF